MASGAGVVPRPPVGSDDILADCVSPNGSQPWYYRGYDTAGQHREALFGDTEFVHVGLEVYV